MVQAIAGVLLTAFLLSTFWHEKGRLRLVEPLVGIGFQKVILSNPNPNFDTKNNNQK